uniref:Uncharacterized protein n=1 Tax=Rhizophora mucronata TaxID=61149 RepID=A0A2P2NIC9_RHIMU
MQTLFLINTKSFYKFWKVWCLNYLQTYFPSFELTTLTTKMT